MSFTQQAQVAGLFYPADAAELSELISSLLAQSDNEQAVPKAIIAPHAGLIYSGEIAASAYACLQQANYKKVILLAPAHILPFVGIATLNADSYATPLGQVAIDRDKVDKASELEFVQALDLAAVDEHALEVQLPFLQTVLGDFELTPFIIGNTSARSVEELLGHIVDDDTLVVISSDLSHFQAYSVAKEIDQQTADAIVTGDADNLSCDDACGFIGIRGLMNYATRHHWQGHCLDLRNSGDTAGDKESVVGYGAFHFLPTD